MVERLLIPSREKSPCEHRRLLVPRGRGLSGEVACAWASPSACHETGDRPDQGLRLIALFKFAKTALLMVVGLGALQLLDPGIMIRAQRWTSAVATGSDRGVVQQLVAQLPGLSPGRLEVLALGAFLYSGLFATEGVGLWLGRRWAEYLTVLATASFVPIEFIEVLQNVSLLRVGALVLNLAAVAYLVYRLSRSRTVILGGNRLCGMRAQD